eukprot:EG_transcript_4707
MLRLSQACLLLGLVWGGNGALQPTVEVEVTAGRGGPIVLHGVPPPAQDSALLADSLAAASPLRLVEARPANACTALALSPPPRGPFAVVVQRGLCEFGLKILNAERAGASAVLITESLTTLYNFSSGEPRLQASEGGPCLLRCDLGEGEVPLSTPKADILKGLAGSTCAQSERCPSHMCGVSGEQVGDSYRACCLPDRYVMMDLGNRTARRPAIPAVFLGASAATDLERALRGGGPVVIRVADAGAGLGWLVGAFLIWVLGCSVEALSTWLSAQEEREWVATGGAGAAGEKRQHGPEEPVVMTVETAMGYLLVATVGLVGLFLLVQQSARVVVFVMIGVFSIATLNVVTSLGTYPVVHRLAPQLDRQMVTVPLLGQSTVAWLVGFAITLAAVVYWIVTRHGPYAWIFQDTFAVFVCCQFVQALRMNSIKVSYALLVSFMLYDIFMVFLSPLIFKSSVMVTVAQAGSGSISISKTNPFHCERIPDERMPMLFMLPRFGSEGEYAMLGLGDVLLPGLLLSFMLRYDTLARAKDATGGCCGLCYLCRRYPYWTVGVVGYVVGLLLAFLANTLGFTIFDVKGQPALLYLVPCTLIPLTLLALVRGEFMVMWEGPPELRQAEADAAAATADHTPEARGLLKQEPI